MTHQNHQTNGASLEDCHTNFFALTDLCGIKWRKFVNGERPNASSDLLEDPILRSYSRCMQADILCVWRRIQSTKQDNSDPNALPFEINSSRVHPPLSLAAAKELWIFWYGEEPDLSELVDGDLLRTAANQSLWNGTWERGLTYECRSLLFKALHNLMERFVLTKDIVRFGKWFVQPCTSNDRFFGTSSQHLSFSFTFFVHGDTVCASIDLREHPAVRQLTKEHLAEAAAAYSAASNSVSLSQSHDAHVANSPADASSQDAEMRCSSGNAASQPKPRKVILAPFGMAAKLTGNSYSASDPMAEKILEEWASFFPLCNKENSDVPPVVEVVSGGHKMYHPSIYVLVTDLDDVEEMEAASAQKDASGLTATTSSAEAAALAALSTANPTENAAARKPGVGVDIKPTITTTTTVTNTLTITTKEQKLKEYTKSLPFYDSLTSNFTCNTINTHAPPQAATEMPERVWQDCITNTLHVAYSCATTSLGTTTPSSHSQQCDDAADANASATGVDTKPQAQTQPQQHQVWNFVDPAQKAPCICVKCQLSTKKPTTTPTAGGGIATTSSSAPPTAGGLRLALAKPHSSTSSGSSTSTGSSSIFSGSHGHSHGHGHVQHSHHQHHHRPSTPSSHTDNANQCNKLAMRASKSVPFHKRRLDERGHASLASSTTYNISSGNASNSKHSNNSNKSHSGGDATPSSSSTSAAFGGYFYHNTDTIPKLRSSTTPHGTPHGGASSYSRNSIGDSLPVPSVGSPGTPAPSPHPNSALSQPTSVPPADQVLAMSPRAPTSVSNLNLQQSPAPIEHQFDKNTPAPTPTDQHDSKSITASPYVHPAPSVEQPLSAEGMHGSGGMGPGSVPQPPSVGPCTPTIGQPLSQQPTQQAHSMAAQPSGGGIKKEAHQAVGPDGNQRNSALAATTTNDEVNEFIKLHQPPKLYVRDVDCFTSEDGLKLEVLYDFTQQDEWLYHSFKRMKPNEVTRPNQTMNGKNLYEGHSHFKPVAPTARSMFGSQVLSIDASASISTAMDVVPTENNVGSGVGLVSIVAESMETNGSDESGNTTTATAGFFQGLDIKTEVMPGTASPCKESKISVDDNLYTNDGLIPSIKDLEQIFETSSNEECSSVQIHTPPDSNNPSNGCASTNTIDDLKRNATVATVVASVSVAGGATLAALQNNASSNMNNSGANTIPSEDLTKMFPTPPSHEQHHPNSSPCQMDIQMTDLSVTTTSSLAMLDTNLSVSGIMKIKQEFPVELGSPMEEPIEDWSYVYRPPQQAKFVGSSKYAPLTNLPSQAMPPLTIPPNCTYKPSWTQSRAAAAAQVVAAVQQQQQQQLHQQQHQHQHHHQQQQQHQQLHELLSAAPRTPLQQPRTPLGPIPSPMHSNTVTPPLSSSGSNLLLNQLNCPQAALTNTPGGGGSTMQQLLHRATMPPSPAPASVPFPRGSPMMHPQRQTPIHPPPPYELAVASPATSTSSYLNKPFNSQEPPHTPHSVGMSTHVGGPHSAAGNLATTELCPASAATRELPEVSSLLVNILLYDTALNVFRDHNFDSSTVCVCNADSQKVGNIRGADSGVYVPLPGSTFNPAPAAPGGAAGGSVSTRMLSAFGGASALDSPASLPGAGSGHTGSSSSSSTTPASNQHITGYVDDDPVDCTCGFSAAKNRLLAHRAGLFYEDEMEITGLAEDPCNYKKQSLVALITSLSTALSTTAKPTANNAVGAAGAEKSPPQADQQAYAILELLLEQCSIIQTSSTSVHRALQRQRRVKHSRQPQHAAALANVLEFVDANDIICLALEQARLAYENSRMDISDFAQQHQLSPFHAPPPTNNRRSSAVMATGGGKLTVHKWPYIPVGFTRSNKDIVRIMNSIQPMLQNAFHSKSRSAAGTKDATYTVSGPLTWRMFHRLAGRASGQCEPQPIPSVIVGHDKDWVSVAPLAIHYWDKFLLEPYSYARDVVYLIVCPDNDFVVDKVKTYFKELSTTYEMCKLGRHTPIKGWDGLLTVGHRQAGSENLSTSLDEWLRTLTDTTLSEQIRLYAYAFQKLLAPYLSRVPGDKTLLNPPEPTGTSNQHANNRDRVVTSPMTSSSSSTSTSATALAPMHSVSAPMDPENTSSTEQSTDSNLPDANAEVKPEVKLGDPLGMGDTMEDINPPAIVLYVVDPFTFGSDSSERERLSCIALLRIYAELLKNIPESVRANMNIQIISLESIVELGRTRARKRFSDEIKCLALNIFAQCRRHMVHAQTVKSLTGFGTAANMETFLKSKDEKNRQPYKMYTPPYVLAHMHEKNDKTDFSRSALSMRGLNEQKYSVMYCNYCLSEDQAWLLATATDDRGELLEKIVINIDVPNRARRRKVPARRIGLQKLMDFILGLISQTVHTWRLVIGRIGRIGHGELKSWSYLLSKQNLQKASKQLKDMCKQCTLMFPPSILSACLVTLEPDAKLRVMPDQFTPDERFSQISMQNPLSTPQDVTCTHILVFPTSAVCLSFTRQFINDPQDLGDDLFFEECEDDGEDFPSTADLMMTDLFGGWETQPDRMSNHGSPDRMEDNRSWQSAGANNFNSTQQQDVEEVGSINQQPLAVGYMVSTAPTGRMPSWFWAACPHLEDVCPVFLKTALHLHVPNIQTTDDILNSTNAHSSATDHPLDSTLTADVLRYVLEGYNALSWLALDSNTHDRLSCLPINVQTLMDLYYLTAAFV